MPRLEEFTLTIQTAAGAGPERLEYEINGFTVDFDQMEGQLDAESECKVVGRPRSFPHSLALIGPENGEWEIAAIEAAYHCDGAEPYTVRMGPVTLDGETKLNIWHDPPLPVFDV